MNMAPFFEEANRGKEQMGDPQLCEGTSHDKSSFPISYFQDELALLPNQTGPLHWHPECEIHYAEKVTLTDIAGAAGISRSEAGRCFQVCMGCSPVDALIQYIMSRNPVQWRIETPA